jgi:hypothetical protein
MTFAVNIAQSGSNNQTMRNRIINGAMTISQRLGTSSITPTATTFPWQYNLDRWFTAQTQASRISIQQNAGSVTPPPGFTNYVGITSLATTTVGSSDVFLLQQRIEGFNTADLAWGTANAQPVTLSFWVRSSLTGSFGGSFTNVADNRSYAFSYTISAANTWEYKTITAPGDTTGTWETTTAAGILVSFTLGIGSSLSGAANSWTSGLRLAPTGAVSVVGTNGATLYITGVQFEEGTAASPFENRLYGQELQLCQRYCQLNQSATGEAGSSSEGAFVVPFYVVMRATPTMSLVIGTDRIDEFYAGRKTITSVGVVYGNSAAGTGVGITLNSSGLTGNALLGLFSGCLLFSAEL